MNVDRALLQSVYDNIVGSLGYKTTVGLIDKGKVERRLAGTTPIPKRPSARLACAAYDVAGLLAPTTFPPPPPPSPLAPVWQRDGLFVNAVSSFDGARKAAALAAGFKDVYVQLLHAPNYQSNVDHLNVLRNDGFTVSGWGTYGQGSDPAQDARDAAQLVRQFGLKGWKANGEAWAEAEHSWKTNAFRQAWLDAGAPCPLGWSVLSSDTANFGRLYDYLAALAVPGADIDLQVYGATHPTYTVGAGLGMLRNTPVPVDRTAMTFDVTASGGGPFADYRTWPGPRRLWVGEWSTADTFRQLAR